MTPSRTYMAISRRVRWRMFNWLRGDPYVELGVTTRSLVETSLLDLGAVGTARGGAEQRLAGKGPAGGHGGN